MTATDDRPAVVAVVDKQPIAAATEPDAGEVDRAKASDKQFRDECWDLGDVPYEQQAKFEVLPASHSQRWQALVNAVQSDYREFYSSRGLIGMGAGLGIGAVIANTTLDEHFEAWHDAHVESGATRHFSESVRWLGDGGIVIPTYVLADWFGDRLEDSGLEGLAIHEWGERCLRGVAVGLPAVTAFKYLLNASRPEADYTSHWRPFDSPYADGAVSGHTFIGALSFLTAAQLTDDPAWKAALVFGSIVPGWTRMQDDRHYLSQVVLGWSFAWLATRAVDRTDRQVAAWDVVPVATPELSGLGVRWSR